MLFSHIILCDYFCQPLLDTYLELNYLESFELTWYDIEEKQAA